MKKVLLPPLLAVLLTVQPAAGIVRHVKQDAPGNNTGTSWANAYRDLRTALNAAVAGDQVWIAAGIYYADYDAATNTRTGDRSLRFPLKTQLTVLGGFAGIETTAAERDWRANRTILNGEAGVPGSRTDNTLTIMGSASLVTGVVIDGLVFANGNTDSDAGPWDDWGGALYLNGDGTLRHCVFVNNYARYGGAVFCSLPPGLQGPPIRVEQCLFANNQAFFSGGAINFNTTQMPLEVTHSTFLGNLAQHGQDIQTVDAVNVFLRGNIFSSNSLNVVGGPLLEYNVWPMSAGGTGNVTWFGSSFTQSPSAGPDNLWGTMDDFLEAPLRADSPAVNLSTAASLPRDTGDTDGDGVVNEPAPFDAARRSRINDGLPDAGAFEMVNVAPGDITLALTDLIETSPAGTNAGSLTADDENAGAHVFTLVSGAGDAGNAAFTIVGNQLRAAQAFDYETQSSYSVRIRATDSMGLWLEKAFIIPVANRIEQTVWIETVKAGGNEPAGGVSGRTGPGGWPEHWAVAKVRRSGPESSGPLDMTLFMTDETYGPGDTGSSDNHFGEFRIHSDDGITTFAPYVNQLPLHLDAGQSEMLLGIEPLFDFSNSPEPPGTVTLTIEDGQASYTIGTPASAVLTIYDSPAAQWSAESGIPADAAGLAAFALGNSLSVASGVDPCMMVSALLNPNARDVAVTWESSEDLASWTNTVPLQTIWPASPGQPVQWCLAAQGPRRFYRPRGVSTQQTMGFGTGVDAAKMVFIPAGAGFIPQGPSNGALRFLFQHPFWIGRTEVSSGDLLSLDFPAPGGSSPATGWTPGEINAYCQRAMERGYYGVLPAGYVLRLPTEAEWVYAASPPYAFDPPPATPLESRAWYLNNAFGVPHGVGARLPNERGIHDMLGNVSEWTTHRLVSSADAFIIADESNLQPDAAFSIICGGNIWQGAEAQTASQRVEYPNADPSPLIGFRVVIARPLPPAP